MKYLGIDFGSKRVGVAVSDENARLAFPFSVLENNQKLLEKIQDIIDKEKIERIVVGESYDFKGEPNKIMKEIEGFKKLLEEKTKIEVLFEPEFLTSREAEQIQGKNKMHDASAATIILQSYLDRDSYVNNL